MIEKTISCRQIYEGKILNLRVDEVLLPNDKTSLREIVEHNGAVAIVAVTDNDKILLVRQYRKAVERVLIEIPAGKLEKEETPYDCAERELIEETGFRANQLKKVMEIITSPGFCTEKIHLFVANNLVVDYLENDEDEFIDLITLDLDEALGKIVSGEIVDSKTIIGLLYYKMYHSAS
ncbi:MAG TPA: ADP-ribose pyrophosphatase [Clostridiales bacterium]|nr:ADP-ribose pyrophosphatase [Clostridiales bacterium]